MTYGNDEKTNILYEIYKWKEAGLAVRTYVECDSFIRLGTQRFSGKYYGRLMAVDIIGVQQIREG